MNLRRDIAGLPSIGRPTLFNVLTQPGIGTADYPFCAIEPNAGIAKVPDPHMAELTKIVNPQKMQSATVEFVDIAGLVADTSKGEGLGNQFLANTRKTDTIVSVARCFDDDNIVHITSKVDPIADIETINTKLAPADSASTKKTIVREEKRTRSGGKDTQKLVELYKKPLPHLGEGKLVRPLDLDAGKLAIFRPLFLLTAKPTMYVSNVSEDGFENSSHLDRLKELAKKENVPTVAIRATMESEAVELENDKKIGLLVEMDLEEPGLNRLIRAGHDFLGLQTYFTAGIKKVRAWTIRKGDTTLQAASAIHADFGRGFIRTQVIPYEDFITLGGEAEAKEAGRMYMEGKEYVVQDGDVMHFLFSV